MNFLSKSFFWIQKITLIISKNWLENQQKTVNLMIFQSLILNWLNNKHYQTLKDLENNPNDKIKQLKEIFPDIFQDGILNFQLLKQHLEQSENIAETNVFGLYWNGKNKANINSRTPLNWKTLKPLRDKSLNFDEAQNVIIEGDNLEALKILQKAYFNRVDVIYIDPPYNTGSDFVYDDDYSQSVQDYKKINNLVDEEDLKTTTNQKTTGRFHTNWLNMIYPRLVLARSLLKDDGVIFISIDDNEQARLKLICDEIFGEDNFISTLIWLRNPGGESDNSHIANTKDFILMYSKNANKFQINELKKEKNILDFKIENNEIWKKGSMLEKSGENDRLIDRKNLGYVIYYHEKNKKVLISHDYKKELIHENLNINEKIYNFDQNLLFEGFVPIIPRSIKNTYGCWRIGEKKFFELYNEGKILFEKQKDNSIKVFEKIQYIIENPYALQKPKDFISFTTNSKGTNEMKKLFFVNPFTKPKPSDLISYLVNFHKNKNALVLDFFAGSGTTAQAVMELNQEDDGKRQYILVQLPEKLENDSEFKTICDITKARIERSIAKYQYKDKGFKYFKVASTNFQFWRVTTKDDDQTIEKQLDLFSESINEQNDYEAILYELMLKSGMRLDWNIKDRIVNEHQLWIDEQIDNLFFLKPQNLEQVLEIIKQVLKEKTNDSDTKVYISEAYFTGQFADQNKLNLCEQIKQFNKQESKQIKLMVV